MKQEVFGSRITMMLAMLGMAVGTGNIWRFPRIAAQNGGGEFLIAWVVFLFLWSIPLILLEFGLGRKTRRGPVRTFMTLMGPRWVWMGAFVVWVTTAITFYYSVVAGWTFRFAVASATGELNGSRLGEFWNNYISSAWPLVTHVFAIGLAVLVVARGVKWIEQVTKLLMPALLILVIALVVRAVTLPGAEEGLGYLFSVDWANLTNSKLWVEALIQNAWDTGAGRGFCAGMDMGGGATPDAPPPVERPPVDSLPDPEGRRLNMRQEVEAYIALRRLEVPVIASINGPCVGAGFDLACHCDLAVGSTAARYQVAYVRRGLYADLGGFWSIPKILGWRKAMELMMTGRFMSAEEAHEAGLTNYLVEPEQLAEKTMEFAQEIEAGPPIAQKIGKVLAYRTSTLDFESAMAWSETAIPLVDMSQDFREGRQAFIEKRDADFQGR